MGGVWIFSETTSSKLEEKKCLSRVRFWPNWVLKNTSSEEKKTRGQQIKELSLEDWKQHQKIGVDLESCRLPIFQKKFLG